MDRQAKIVELIRAIKKEEVSPAADESLFDSGVLNSFDLPDLVSAIEKEFSVTVPDSDLNPRKFDSVERIDAYLESLQ